MAFVVSLNVRRRNLTASQRAIAAAEAWDQYEIGAGRPAGKSAESRQNSKGWTRDRLADLFGVNKDYIQQARALDAELAAEERAAGA